MPRKTYLCNRTARERRRQNYQVDKERRLSQASTKSADALKVESEEARERLLSLKRRRRAEALKVESEEARERRRSQERRRRAEALMAENEVARERRLSQTRRRRAKALMAESELARERRRSQERGRRADALMAENDEARERRLSQTRIKRAQALMAESEEARERRLSQERRRRAEALMAMDEEARERRLSQARIKRAQALMSEDEEARERRLSQKRRTAEALMAGDEEASERRREAARERQIKQPCSRGRQQRTTDRRASLYTPTADFTDAAFSSTCVQRFGMSELTCSKPIKVEECLAETAQCVPIAPVPKRPRYDPVQLSQAPPNDPSSTDSVNFDTRRSNPADCVINTPQFGQIARAPQHPRSIPVQWNQVRPNNPPSNSFIQDPKESNPTEPLLLKPDVLVVPPQETPPTCATSKTVVPDPSPVNLDQGNSNHTADQSSDSLHGMLKEVMKELHVIRTEVHSVRILAEDLKAHMYYFANRVIGEPLAKLNPTDLPVKTLEAFHELDRQLADPICYQTVELYMDKFVGETGPQFIRFCLDAILTADVARQMSPCGRNGDTAFRRTNFHSLIMKQLRKRDLTLPPSRMRKVMSHWFFKFKEKKAIANRPILPSNSLNENST